MSILGRPIVVLLPFVPRFIVRWISKRYVAGENIDQAMSVIKKLISMRKAWPRFTPVQSEWL